jgi:hypothetical protein
MKVAESVETLRKFVIDVIIYKRTIKISVNIVSKISISSSIEKCSCGTPLFCFSCRCWLDHQATANFARGIIAPTQSVFILGRMITDNALIAFECLHAIRS